MVRVINLGKNSRVCQEPDEVLVRIDRTNGILGNFFGHANDDRERKIARCRAVVMSDVQRHGPIWRELHRLAGLAIDGQRLALGCWCAPEACHGDLYVEIIKGYIETDSWRRV